MLMLKNIFLIFLVLLLCFHHPFSEKSPPNAKPKKHIFEIMFGIISYHIMSRPSVLSGPHQQKRVIRKNRPYLQNNHNTDNDDNNENNYNNNNSNQKHTKPYEIT